MNDPRVEKQKPVPPFVQFCCAAIPQVFDDSLSYYEALCAMWKYLDETVKVINNNAMVTEDFIAKVEELHNYVEHYFDNLDVQEEINNKLDEMADDGTLQEIITTYIQANVAWTFDTVADMKAAENFIDGSFARTLGFHAVNDGGAALYKVRTVTNDDVVDEASIIELADDTLVAEYIHEDKGFLNVNKFGLTDQLYMNDYWDKIYNYALAKGCYIYFPTGTYKVKKVNVANDYVFTGKLISMKGENAIILCEDSVDSSTDLFKFVGCANNYNQFIEGLEFSCQTNDYTKVRYFLNFIFEKAQDILYNFRVENNLFRKNSSYAIYTAGYSNGGFNNCQFSHNIAYGLFFKSLSFGDSNKIIGNSLYGSEEIELNNYVLDITQTSGSAGCSISENNCSSGLGKLSGFIDLLLANNQIENTTQENLDYVLKLDTCRDTKIVACNLNSHIHSCGLIYSSGNNVHIESCSMYSYGTLVASPNHPIFVKGVRGNYGVNTFINLLPNGSCSGLVTMYDLCSDNDGTIYVDNNMIAHLFAGQIKSYSFAPWKINGDITAGMTITNIDSAQLYFNAAYSVRFDVLPKVPMLLEATY